MSIAVARRSRHNRLASRSTNSRSTMVSASKPEVTDSSKAVQSFLVLQRRDHSFCCQPMTHGVAARTLFSGVCCRPGALERIPSIGIDLPEGRHTGFSIGFVLVVQALRADLGRRINDPSRGQGMSVQP